jgi:hypothetical protein
MEIEKQEMHISLTGLFQQQMLKRLWQKRHQISRRKAKDNRDVYYHGTDGVTLDVLHKPLDPAIIVNVSARQRVELHRSESFIRSYLVAPGLQAVILQSLSNNSYGISSEGATSNHERERVPAGSEPRSLPAGCFRSSRPLHCVPDTESRPRPRIGGIV